MDCMLTDMDMWSYPLERYYPENEEDLKSIVLKRQKQLSQAMQEGDFAKLKEIGMGWGSL